MDIEIMLMHILNRITLIQNVQETDKNLAQNVHWYAVARHIEVIGEATKHLFKDNRESFPDVPWFTIEHLRDLLNHAHYKMIQPSPRKNFAQNLLTEINELETIFKKLNENSTKTESIKNQRDHEELKQDVETKTTVITKLKEEENKGLKELRTIALKYNLCQDNEKLQTDDLMIIKSRMRLPSLDLMIIKKECDFFITLIDNKEIEDNILQPAIEHCIGVMGQSMKELISFHPHFIKEANLIVSFKPIIHIRNKLMHQTFSVDFDEIKTAKNEIINLNTLVKDVLGNRMEIFKTISDNVPTEEADREANKSPSKEPDHGKNFPFDFADDFFEKAEEALPKSRHGYSSDDDKSEEALPKSRYGYFSDDDKIVSAFFNRTDDSLSSTENFKYNTIYTQKEIFEEQKERTMQTKKLY